jgi:hypothetical protein
MPAANRLARGRALTGALGLVAAIVAGGGGCELAVGDSLPPFTCLPGAANTCPAGFVCVPATQECESRSGLCTPTSCGAESVCDSQTLKCTPIGGSTGDDGQSPDASTAGGDAGVSSGSDATNEANARSDGPDGTGQAQSEAGSTPDGSTSCRGVGCSCTGGAACDSNICAASQTVTNDVTQADMGNFFCTQPCCTSADCPGSSVCFATGAGGNYCVLPAWLGRTTPTLGVRAGGAACTSNKDCRSGLCASSMCADTCCSLANAAAECATGTTCRFGTFPGLSFDTHAAAFCGPVTACTGGFQCNHPCRSTAECGAGQACYYLPANLPNKDINAACTTGDGPGVEGSKCSTDFQCASNFCDTTTMECSDVCFADTDCTVDGWHCRPATVVLASGGSDSVLTCGP